MVGADAPSRESTRFAHSLPSPASSPTSPIHPTRAARHAVVSDVPHRTEKSRARDPQRTATTHTRSCATFAPGVLRRSSATLRIPSSPRVSVRALVCTE
jgi:hypothetical protein